MSVSEITWSRNFTEDETEQILQGVQPAQMEDKWSVEVQSEKKHIDFKRSWTGRLIFRLRLAQAAGERTSSVGALFVEDATLQQHGAQGATETFESVLDAVVFKVVARGGFTLEKWSLLGRASLGTPGVLQDLEAESGSLGEGLAW